MATSERMDQPGDRALAFLPGDQQADGRPWRAGGDSVAFERFGGLCAVLAGVGGLAYALAFVVVSRVAPELGGFLSALLLLADGLLAAPALLSVYYRVRATDASFALLGLAFGLAGNLGAVLHGGYDLANAIHPPTAPNLDLPNPVDPRGLATFGLVGLGLLVLSWLMVRTPGFPQRLARLGYVLSALLLVLYLSRLIVLTPTSLAVLVPVLVTGFLINPAWFIWLGVTLRSGASRGEPAG